MIPPTSVLRFFMAWPPRRSGGNSANYPPLLLDRATVAAARALVRPGSLLCCAVGGQTHMSTRHLGACLIVLLLPAQLLAFGADGRLMDAAEEGDQALVRQLIERGVDVNAKGVDGMTALHHAVHSEHL